MDAPRLLSDAELEAEMSYFRNIEPFVHRWTDSDHARLLAVMETRVARGDADEMDTNFTERFREALWAGRLFDDSHRTGCTQALCSCGSSS